LTRRDLRITNRRTGAGSHFGVLKLVSFIDWRDRRGVRCHPSDGVGLRWPRGPMVAFGHNRFGVAGLRLPPLPHNPACGSARGGSHQTFGTTAEPVAPLNALGPLSSDLAASVSSSYLLVTSAPAPGMRELDRCGSHTPINAHDNEAFCYSSGHLLCGRCSAPYQSGRTPQNIECGCSRRHRASSPIDRADVGRIPHNAGLFYVPYPNARRYGSQRSPD
jgi:hypothetical protein